MSATNEDIERNQQEEEDIEKSIFSLRNAYIVLGSLVAVAILLVLLGTVGNASVAYLPNFLSHSNQKTSSSSDLIIFQLKGKVHSIIPSNSKLQSKFIFDNGRFSFMNNVQLTKDKKRFYFFNLGNYIYDFDTHLVSPVGNIPEYDGYGLLVKKPDLRTILYGSESGNIHSSSIRHYNIDEQILIKDYPTKCPKNRSPYLVEQSFDGSKLLYRCTASYVYFLKNLEDPNSEDRSILNLRENMLEDYVSNSFFSLDGSKMIFSTVNTDYWTLINLNSRIPTEIRKIYFSIDPEEFQQLYLSEDMEKIYFVIKNEEETEVRLYEIEYSSLFENDYSSPLHALNIGLGRSIELGPESEN